MSSLMMIPNDVVEYVILAANPATFLSSNRRLNAAARSSIERNILNYTARLIGANSVATKAPRSWPNRVLTGIIGNSIKQELMDQIFMNDAANCLHAIYNYVISDQERYNDLALNYDTKIMFTMRAYECLREMLDWDVKTKLAALAQVFALRTDDIKMLDIVLNASIKYKSKLSICVANKLYCALIDRRMACYRYLLDRCAPNLATYEYLVSQDLHSLLDETLNHPSSSDFKVDQLNTYEFHRFAGDSANVATIRVLIKHGFDPSRHNKAAISVAVSHNMGAALVMTRYCE